jgi:prolyl oligopeptidase
VDSVAFGVIFFLCGCAQADSLKTVRKAATTNYHGVTVVDEYQWLEDADAPDVQVWSRMQETNTQAYFEPLPARTALEHRLSKLYDQVSSSYFGLQSGGGTLFCLRQKPPATHAMLVRVPSFASRGVEVLVNPNLLDTNGGTRIEFFQPSPDGKLVAVCLSEKGTDGGTLYVYDGASGRRLSDVVSRVYFSTAGGSVAWEDQGFYYTRYPRAGEQAPPELRLHQQIYYHRLDTPEAQDRYEIGQDWPRLARITLKTALDARHVLATLADGPGGRMAHWLRRPANTNGSPGSWRQVTQFSDEVKQVEFGRDPLYLEWPSDPSLYLLSHQKAPHGRILKIPLAQPDLAQAREVIKEGEKALDKFVLTATGMFVNYADGGPSESRFYDFYPKQEQRVQAPESEPKEDNEAHPDDEDKEMKDEELADEEPEPGVRGGGRRGDAEREPKTEWKIELPGFYTVHEVICARGDLLLFRVSSFTQPTSWLAYDRNRIFRTAFDSISPISFSDVETVRVSTLSKDGTKVPISIVRRRGTRVNGENPTLLLGFGNFGQSLSPSFDFTRRVWFDQGGIVAVAHVRGGGEYGEAWHQAATLTDKQKAIDDFIACAEFLIRSNYTTAAKLAIADGGQASPLMGAALTQHPELFRAVVTDRGVFDMLRAETDSGGAFNVTEFGSVGDRSQFQALHAYSPYHRVTNRTAYPSVLLLQGDEEERAAAAQSRKMAARLQTASASRHPILLRRSGKTFEERLAQLVDVYSFLFEQLGVDYTLVARGPWSGAVTPTSALVKARLAETGLDARLALSLSPTLAHPVYSALVTSETNHNNVVSFPLDGLRPDTEYHYALEVKGRLDRTRRGRFRTFPTGPASFSFAYASCARTASTSDVFDTIRENRPLFFLHTGDFHYENIQTNDLARFRNAYDRVLFSPQQGDLYRSTPLIYVWDDHDFGGNNANRRAGSHDVARFAYDEYVPHYPLQAGSEGPIYQSFSVGRVKFIVTDLRSERDPSTNRDDAKKSMMGARQKEWFKNELLTANGQYPLICWVSSVPWIGTKGSNYYRVATNVYGYLHHTTVTNVPDPRAGRRNRPPGSEEDHWSVYSNERRELADFIKSNHIQGVCILHGDSHMLAADDGTFSDYATGGGAPIPVMCGGPLDQQASLKGGPYSQGVYRVKYREGEGAFAWMTVIDRRDEIELRYSGRNLRNEEKVALHFKVPARAGPP